MKPHLENHNVETPTKTSESFFRRHRWLSLIGIGIILYFLLIEHRHHVLPYLPWLIILACPLMHFFMHGHHKKHHEGDEEKK